MAVLENKARFITEINDGTLKIQNLKKEQVIEKLVQAKYLSQKQIEDIGR